MSPRGNPETIVRRARAKRDQAEREFADAVVQAYRQRGDMPIERIAEAAGITRQRIHQIVKEADRAH